VGVKCGVELRSPKEKEREEKLKNVKLIYDITQQIFLECPRGVCRNACNFLRAVRLGVPRFYPKLEYAKIMLVDLLYIKL
jgi:hypothetical protein